MDKYRAQWSNTQKTGAISFTKSSLKNAVKCYFKSDNKMFREIIGIRMAMIRMKLMMM